MSDIASKTLGAMFGVAVGDALGAPLKQMSAKAIRQRCGVVREMIGGGCLGVLPGEVTDDTQMTLMVAKGIVSNPGDPVERIGKMFIDWMNSSPREISGTCVSSISRAARRAGGRAMPSQQEWMESAQETHGLFGGRAAESGALARTAYVGLYYNNEGETRKYADLICRMTHWDERAARDCENYSAAIFYSIRIPNAEPCRRLLFEVFTEDGVNAVHNLPLLADKNYVPAPTECGVDSLNAALHCVLTTKSFEKALVKAVNLGGEADTIGAITGGLAGAIYGIEEIPERWIQALDPEIVSDLSILSECALDR